VNFKGQCACADGFDVSAAGLDMSILRIVATGGRKPHLALRPLEGELWSGVCLGIEFRGDIITLADCRCDPYGVTIVAEGIYEGGQRGRYPSSRAPWHFLTTDVKKVKVHPCTGTEAVYTP